MPPLVSICLPNLNSMPFLEARMESIVGQTLSDWELIVCDSGSNDGSWEFLGRLSDEPRARLHQVPREGLYAGWNECLRRARGKYVYIASADDTADPCLLDQLVGVLERHPDAALAICRYDTIDEDGRRIERQGLTDVERFLGGWLDRPHRRDGKADLLIQLCLGCDWDTATAMVFRRELLEKTGLFRTDCMSHADTAWRLEAALHTDLLYVPAKLATWRVRSGQATAGRPDNYRKLYYDCALDAIARNDGLLPEAWKTTHDYRDRLLFHSRNVYFSGYCLSRKWLRKKPPLFAAGCLRAALKEPGYLLRRIAEGFSWDSRGYVDDIEYLEKLLDEWNIAWPPVPIPAA